MAHAQQILCADRARYALSTPYLNFHLFQTNSEHINKTTVSGVLWPPNQPGRSSMGMCFNLAPSGWLWFLQSPRESRDRACLCKGVSLRTGRVIQQEHLHRASRQWHCCRYRPNNLFVLGAAWCIVPAASASTHQMPVARPPC